MQRSMMNAKKLVPAIEVPFPPQIDVHELVCRTLQKSTKAGNRGKPPNAFFIYRGAFADQLKATNCNSFTQARLSQMASESWKRETKKVKEWYRLRAVEAECLFRKMCPPQFSISIIEPKRSETVKKPMFNDFTFIADSATKHVQERSVEFLHYTYPPVSQSCNSSKTQSTNSTPINNTSPVNPGHYSAPSSFDFVNVEAPKSSDYVHFNNPLPIPFTPTPQPAQEYILYANVNACSTLSEVASDDSNEQYTDNVCEGGMPFTGFSYEEYANELSECWIGTHVENTQQYYGITGMGLPYVDQISFCEDELLSSI